MLLLPSTQRFAIGAGPFKITVNKPCPEKRIIKGRPFGVGLIVRINAYVNTKRALSRFATEGLSCLAHFR